MLSATIGVEVIEAYLIAHVVGEETAERKVAVADDVLIPPCAKGTLSPDFSITLAKNLLRIALARVFDAVEIGVPLIG